MSLSNIIAGEFEALESLRQRKDYHPEVYVWDHAAYVAHSLRQMTETGSVEQEELMLVAAFHDIGKIPATDRKSEDSGGYITSYGHAKKSALYWDAVSEALTEGNDMRPEVIRWLIKEHMNIKFMDRMNENTLHDKKKEAESLGDRVWTMGKLFKKADDMLAFFENYGLDYRKDVHASDDHLEPLDKHEEAIGRFQNLVDQIVRTIDYWEAPHDNKDLILVRGAPGSGKTTFAEMIQGPHGRIVATDDFFYENGTFNFDPSKLGEAHEWCRSEVESSMKNGLPRIVVHNTFTQVWEFLRYYTLAARYGYRVHSVIKENRHGGESVHGVPESKVNEMRDRFETRL